MPRPSASDDVFRAIGDGTRRRIVELLVQRPHTPTELAATFDSCQSTVSEHLAILRRAGVIRFEETRGRRTYFLIEGALDDVARWVGAQQRPPRSP